MSLDPAKGFFNAFAVHAAASADAGNAAPGFDFTTGVSFVITPKDGTGPYYVNPDETYASGKTATTGGWGAWFLNLSPGKYTVTATSATMTCTAVPAFSWAQKDGSAQIEIWKGLLTQSVGFFCAPMSADAGKG